MKLAAILAMATALLAGPALAEPVKTQHLEVELVPESTAAVPGGTTYLAIHQKMTPGWHTYWRNPGDSGQATEAQWTLPQGWKAGGFVWPTPHRYVTGPLMNYVYSDEVYLPVPIEVPASAKPGSTVEIKASAHFLVCSDICIPEDADLKLSLPVAASADPDPKWGAAIAKTLAAAPKPDDLDASFVMQGGMLKIAVTGAAVQGKDLRGAYFYPFDGQAIDHAQAQVVEPGKEGITFTLAPGSAFQEGGNPLKQVLGLVAFWDQAYEVTAEPKALPPAAAGAGPPVRLTTPAPGAATAGGAPAPAAPAAPAANMGVLAALGLAFLGGLVLNLMPCVFPVLSMKAAALAAHAEQPAKARAQGLAFLVGVVGSFLALAGALIAAQAGGQAVGWGFQLQSPVVVAVLCLIMLLAALNLSGVFEVGTSAQGVGQGLAARADLLGAFFTGVLAVVVAAPCTAPFMAGAIGWGLTQPPLVALSVFAALGLGLAAPFVLIAFVPAISRSLPRPGAWMATLRSVLAFPMYAAAAWLAWVFALQAGANALVFLFAAAIASAFAAWAWGLSQRSGRPLLPRAFAALGLLAAIPLIAVGAKTAALSPAEAAVAETGASPQAEAKLPSEPWSPERVAALQAEGRPVFVDFTAAWCVTCQVNERTALAGARVAQAFADTGAVYLKADWTNRDDRIARALKEQGRSGVPLYLVYGKSGPPQILPQLLTEGLVVKAIQTAKAS
jgi:thiol:disulfide interchange protein DsbD